MYTPAMLAQLVGVPVAVVRRWHRRGLIKPEREVRRLPYFDFQEVATARRLAELQSAGASPAAIAKYLQALARYLPHVDRPLAQLAIVVESHPHHAQQLGGETGEPTIALGLRGAGLAGGGDAETAGTDAGGGSAASHLFQKIDHDVGHARIEHAMALRLVLVNRRVVARPHLRDPARLHAALGR